MASYTLRAGGWSAEIEDTGASLLRLRGPDGHDWITQPRPDPAFRGLFGSVAGPWTNRIPAAPWGLTANDGFLHLHGGVRGADVRHWRLAPRRGRLEAVLRWPEGEEGYPALTMEAQYRLSPGDISWSLAAEASRPVPLNPVHHGYWNLGAAVIDAHTLQINADGLWAPGHDGMAAPPLLPNPFQKARHLEGVWDHTFFLTREASGGREPAAVLTLGNRSMEVWTSTPTLHLYTGDYLPLPRTGICLECGLPPGGPPAGSVPPQRVSSWTRHRFRLAEPR